MMLKKQEKRYKEYLKLHAERDRMYEELWASKLIPLAEPYQKGWLIYADLRNDIKNRKDGNDILDALKLGTTRHVTRQESHVKNVRRNFPVKHPIYPGKVSLKKDKIPPHLRKYFILEGWVDPKSHKGERYILDIPRYWIVRRVKPNIITHAIDNRIRNEIKRISDIMESKYPEFYYRGSRHYENVTNKNRTQQRIAIRKILNGDAEDFEYQHKKGDGDRWD